MQSSKTHIKRWARSLGLDQASDMLVVEQFRLIAQQIPVLYAVIIVNCLFMAALASVHVSGALAFAFPVGAVPVMLYRVYTWRKLTRVLLDEGNIPGMRRGLRVTTIMANVLAAVLAVWSVVILFNVGADKAAFVPLFTILSMITCAHCLSPYPVAAYSVMLSGSSYIAISMVMTQNPFMIAMACNIGVVSVMVVYMARQQYRQLRRLVRSGDKLKRQSGQARVLAYQDQLTNLPNRRALILHMRGAALRRGPALAGMVMLDLNGFKPVNDTFGHAAGDRLLIAIAGRLQAVVGQQGLVARLGGDEFCVFLSGIVHADEAVELAGRLRVAISEPLRIDGHVLHLGAALGVVAGPVLSEDPLRMLQRADIALYDAKLNAGSAISLFEEQMEGRVKRRTLIEHALSDCRELDQIRLEYQPIFALRSGQQVGFEALARWSHGQLGQISPAEFIEIAERTGKARHLTLHLFRRALEEALTWPEELYLSFNLSGSGLCSAGFEESLPKMLDELGFAARRLTIEVTETALLADPAAAWEVLRKLQRRGIRIALDDFGAGHASIGYLRDLELDAVKLDGCLIRDITTNARSRKLLFGVLQLCRSIGVAITAEQVETAEQLRALQAFPIDSVQGFYLGRPVGGFEAPQDGVPAERCVG